MHVKKRDRREAADYLTGKGYRVSYNTLMKWATTGGGPAFRKFGTRVVYDEMDLDAWVEQRLSPLMHSTSEAA